MSSIRPISANLGSANVAAASSEKRKAMLRQVVDEMVGVTFSARF